jgi:hypothetical protein
MGRYIPQMEFIDILIGGRAALEPKFRLYQRLLAKDRAEAVEIAEEYRREHGLLGLFDDLMLPALQLAEQERHGGLVDEPKQEFLLATFREMIEDCAQREQEEQRDRAEAEAGAGSAPFTPTRVLCVPAGDEADEIAGLMLEHLLQAQGYEVDTASVEYLSGELVSEVEQTGARLVFISALPPAALVAARYICKRISSRWPGIPILVGLWHAVGDVPQARSRLENCGAVKIVITYAEALTEMARAAQSLRLLASEPASGALSPAAAE